MYLLCVLPQTQMQEDGAAQGSTPPLAGASEGPGPHGVGEPTEGLWDNEAGEQCKADILLFTENAPHEVWNGRGAGCVCTLPCTQA